MAGSTIPAESLGDDLLDNVLVKLLKILRPRMEQMLTNEDFSLEEEALDQKAGESLGQMLQAREVPDTLGPAPPQNLACIAAESLPCDVSISHSSLDRLLPLLRYRL
ncbi:hypothetical protein WJX81_002829 [Elliptochloris bilobata]|uniref:Uncharacterized protein n=1 Tax=Elliptochloris bilobata TaxID=381761 RepID=A0AAW1SJS5_9CHLO